MKAIFISAIYVTKVLFKKTQTDAHVEEMLDVTTKKND